MSRRMGAPPLRTSAPVTGMGSAARTSDADPRVSKGMTTDLDNIMSEDDRKEQCSWQVVRDQCEKPREVK